MKIVTIVVSILMLSGLAFLGCSGSSSPAPSPWCQIIGPVDDVLVSGIASWGQCTNSQAILASFQAVEKCTIQATSPAFSSLAMNKMSAGPVSAVCQALAPAIIAAVVPSIQGAVVPVAWGCKADSTISALQSVATTLCGLIPVSQAKGR